MKHCFFSFLFFLMLSSVEMMAQKSLYIPKEWQNRMDTLIYKEVDVDNRYTWSKSRSKESENFIVYWDNRYGNTIPTGAASAYRVDVDDLLEKCEAFYALNVGKLAFCNAQNSNVARYKMMVLLNYTTDWVCYGGGYDDVIGALWLSPSTCKPVGHSVAHEVGHSFQYQVYADKKGFAGFRTAIGSGATFWEQTAQWQANQFYPELKWDQSWGFFKQTHNYAMTHEWHRYQSYWWHYYLAEKYGIDFVGQLWRHDAGRGLDPNESLMDMLNMSVDDLYREYFHYAMQMATVDLEAARGEAADYIGTLRYDYVSLSGSKHQVAYSSCPQSTGFNVIPLNVPQAGTTISTEFTSLRNGASLAEDDSKLYFNGEKFTNATVSAYNRVADYAARGFHLGYVALMKDGSRQYFYEDDLYCTSDDENEAVAQTVGCVLPEGVERLFFVVSPAPKRYFQHKWDEVITNDDQWPYTVEFSGTNILGAAILSEGMPIADAQITYDVYFAPSQSSYQSAVVKVEGLAASALGTAFQMQASSVGGVLTAWNGAGPSDGRAMFYAVNADGNINNAGSTANGYGHWFSTSGNRCDYASGYLFSEFDANALTFSLGQYPGKLQNGSNYTIRQAIKYRRGGEEAVVTFVFNIHLTTARTGVELTQVSGFADDTKMAEPLVDPSDPIVPVAIYSIAGVAHHSLQKGINIVKMSDGSYRKVMK